MGELDDVEEGPSPKWTVVALARVVEDLGPDGNLSGISGETGRKEAGDCPGRKQIEGRRAWELS